MKTPLAACLAVAVLTVFLAAGSAAGQEHWLQYKTARELHTAGIRTTSQKIDLATAAPEAIDPPQAIGKEALYAKWQTPMAAAGVWMAFDRSKPAGAYDRLYIDSNADGSLADEEAVQAYYAQRDFSRFGPVKIVFPEGADGPVTYHVRVDCYTRKNHRKAGVYSACWYEGTAEVDGRPYTVRLVDYNGNATFDDTSMNIWNLDYIFIREGRNNPFKLHFAGEFIQLGGALYRPSPARDGAFITFEPVTDVPLGTIAVGEHIDYLSIGGENGMFYCDLSGGKAEVPAGRWRVCEWLNESKDARNVSWTMKGAWFPEESIFEVRPAEETTLAVGKPVKTTLHADKHGRNYGFSERLTGTLGEHINIIRNGALPPVPKLRIKNADGSYNHLLSFAYG